MRRLQMQGGVLLLPSVFVLLAFFRLTITGLQYTIVCVKVGMVANARWFKEDKMTAEVGVMNRLGIALAADSAVSLGPGAEKIYTSVDKLFQLAEAAPVGVMIYGNAVFVEVPWETIIKIYRKQLGNQTFDTLQEYTDNFLKFLENHPTLFPASEQETVVSDLIDEIYATLKIALTEYLEGQFQQKGKLDINEIKVAFADFIDSQLNGVKALPSLEELPNDFDQAFKNRYLTLISDATQEVFGKVPRTIESESALAELVTKLVLSQRRSGHRSGLVVAGFGEHEHFPSLVEIDLYGMADGQLLFCKQRDAVVGRDGGAAIVPFAQSEMVHTFMEGIDPSLREWIESATEVLFRGVSETILKDVKSKHPSYGSALEKTVEGQLAQLLEGLQEEWKQNINQNFASPVMEIVRALPKDELAAMAESLVNLTKFKRRVSRQQETVGGPIDVAVITKGDGFVWVKRKHYFKPELNPRLMSKHLRGDS